MTSHSAEKRAARDYSRENSLSYRVALAAIRAQRAAVAPDIESLAQRLLIEAVEGCGIRHWARVDSWDGSQCLTITDLGGEVYRLTSEGVTPSVAAYRVGGLIESPLDVVPRRRDYPVDSVRWRDLSQRGP